MIIKYHPDDPIYLAFGRVSIDVRNRIVKNGQIKPKLQTNKCGTSWLQNDYLKTFGWSKNYIKAVLKGLIVGNKKLKSFGPNSFAVLFNKYKWK